MCMSTIIAPRTTYILYSENRAVLITSVDVPPRSLRVCRTLRSKGSKKCRGMWINMHRIGAMQALFIVSLLEGIVCGRFLEPEDSHDDWLTADWIRDIAYLVAYLRR